VGYKYHHKFLSPCVGKDCGQYKKKTPRAKYKWGAKEFLSSIKVGEAIEYNGDFSWRSLSSTACRLRRDYGCLFRLTTIKETNKKVIMRLA
jgi:hypothetical protein